MLRRFTSSRAGLLLLFALVCCTAGAQARSKSPPRAALAEPATGSAAVLAASQTHPAAPASNLAAAESNPAAPESQGLVLKLERVMHTPPAVAADHATVSAPQAPPPEPRLYAILGIVLLFLIANIAALLLFGVGMRIWRERRLRRRARFNARWEPVLYARMSGEALALPPLARSERLLFLSLWLHLLGYVRGEAADALAQAARELELPPYALRLLNARGAWKRVVAMQAVAALRLKDAGDILYAKVMQSRPRSSLAAARALLQIDPERGLAGLAHLLSHLQWSPGAVVEIVKAGGSSVGPMLIDLVRSASPGNAKHAVRLIEMLGDESALPVLRERLLSNSDQDEIAAILHCYGKLGGPEDRIAALSFLDHPKWVVRVQAANALGSLGTAPDVDRLLPLLRDRHWWVRYRAARALLRLAGAAALSGVRELEADPYAREMLSRVLAEGQ